tara:strand:- start:1017 stop:1373 length:357 start_codon:yes stop_codon:yes gene_type:complete
MNQTQINRLNKKSKVGWAKYYQAESRHHSEMGELLNIIMGLEQKITQGVDKEIIPDFVKNEIIELKSQLKQKVECPICLDQLEPANIKFSSCGHKYCETCLSKINDCAICRKKIYRKK